MEIGHSKNGRREEGGGATGFVIVVVGGKKREEEECARKEDDEMFLKLCVVSLGVGWSWEIGEMIQKKYKRSKKQAGSRMTETTI